MLDTTRGDCDIRTLFIPWERMTRSERATKGTAIRMIDTIRHTLIKNGRGPEPSISALLRFEIVCRPESFFLRYPDDETCNVFVGVGPGTIRVIQEALLEVVGTKLTVIDMRTDAAKKKRDLPF